MSLVNRRAAMRTGSLILASYTTGCLGLTSHGGSSEINHKIKLSNYADERKVISYSVLYEKEEIFKDSHELQPDEETEGYNFEESPIKGSPTYTIKAVLGEHSVSMFDKFPEEKKTTQKLTTNDCSGDVDLYVSSNGELRSTVAMC